MTFLIVDDSHRFRQSVVRFILGKIPGHHRIFQATDGNEAVTLYEKLNPDWVLMDIAMEPMDGLTSARIILRTHPEAKIIVLTNYGDTAYRDAAKEAGTSAFVLKEHLSDLLTILSQQPT